MIQNFTQKDKMFRSFQIHKYRNEGMVPTVTMSISADVTRMMELRTIANADKLNPTHITVMHLVTKAVADTLKQYPILFSFFTGKEIVDNQEMVISIPVDVEQHVEYIALHNPDDKSLLSIAMETTAELANIRSGKGDFLKNLQRLMENKNESESDPLEFCRQYLGNFVISNFGSFHVDCGTIVIAQPVISGICVGSVKPSVFLQSGQWRETMMLPLTISFDHRPVDGAYVGRFLDSVKKCLESPERLFDNSQL